MNARLVKARKLKGTLTFFTGAECIILREQLKKYYYEI